MSNNPLMASTDDEAFTTAMGNYYAALGRKDNKDAAYWQSELKRLRDTKGGELAQNMSKGRK